MSKQPKPMTGEQLDRALIKLFGQNRQSAFARTIKVHVRTVAGWVADQHKVPTVVAMLVNLMIDTEASPENLRP